MVSINNREDKWFFYCTFNQSTESQITQNPISVEEYQIEQEMEIWTQLEIKMTQTYPQQWRWVINPFPWFSQNQTSRLYKEADKLWIKYPQQLIAKEQEIYRTALPIIKQRKERTDANNKLFNQAQREKDPEKRKLLDGQIRINNIAQLVKEKEWLRDDAPNFEVFKAYALDNPQYQNAITKYINEWDEEVLYSSWLKVCNKMTYYKALILYYFQRIFYSLVFTYLLSLFLQFIYYKWIIYIAYGNKLPE